jgi:hypothetical protein
MLEPQSRQLLLNSLHAPAGYRLDWAVGTTYSLDLLAILSAPVAFAFSDWHDKDGRPTTDPLALLKAVRQYADRICLFCQAGKIHVPRSYMPLLANLEDSIVAAKAPRGGSFHPKVWFLRYVSDDGSVFYRVLCLSRNMTFDRSWDTMLSLEGPLTERQLAYARNHPLGELVEALPQMAVRELASAWQGRLKQLAHEIRRVDLEVPAPFEELAFWPIGIGNSAVWPFPDRMDRAFVVSPFVDDAFVAKLAEHQTPMQLLSRVESLAALQPASLKQFDKTWVLDDTADPESAELEETEPPDAADAGENGQDAKATDDVIPLVGLHAKVYVADVGWKAHIWTGSANATTAGFDKNVELIVQLTGKRGECGVDAILGQPSAKPGKRPASLRDLLCPYLHPDTPTAVDHAEREFERSADRLASALASACPHAKCASGSAAETFAVALQGEKPLEVQVPAGCELRAWPISLSLSAAKLVDLAQPHWVTFAAVSFEGLTSFFAFEVRSVAGPLSRRFVLNVPLVGAPENRREHVLRSMLSDPARVLRFLLLLLTDHDARDFGSLFSEPAAGDEKRSAFHSMFGSTLFESLLRALDRDPDRIDQVEQVVNDLRKTPEGQKLLPKGFDDIWAAVASVRQRQRQPRPRRPE